MTEVELVKELHDEVVSLKEELNIAYSMLKEKNDQIREMYDLIHKKQKTMAKIAQEENSVRNPLISSRDLFRIFSLNAGMCEEAEEIFKSRKENEDA